MLGESDWNIKTIAIIGGTGKEGKGLAYRWAKSGYQILLGSRQLEKAQAAAADLHQMLGSTKSVQGRTNSEAVTAADLAVLTVPFSAHHATLKSLKASLSGKILVDVTVPLVPPRVSRVQMPAAGSAAQEAQQILGSDVQVVSAFQNISYEHLLNDEEVECDVLVCGGNKNARNEVLKLVAAAGLTGWDAGPIENSVVVEGLTSV